MQKRIQIQAGVVAVCLGFGLGASAPVSAQGRFELQYVQPPAEVEPLITAIREVGILEAAADHVNTTLRLPRNVPVVFDTCGQPNAFYNPEVGAIGMCYEFIALFAEIFTSVPDISDEDLSQGIIGSTLFFMLHEIGHALVDVLEIPITGREEDAVDDLAALIMIDAEAEGDLLAAIESFDALAAQREASGAEMAFWDEHSLSIQRAYALDCVIFGSSPEEFGDLVHEDRLPESRAARCPHEFEQKSESWERLLAEHFQ